MLKKSHPKPQTGHSPGSLLVKRQNECPGRTVAHTNPGFRVWGSSWRKESLPPIFALLKIPQSGPILRTKNTKKYCSFSARKHPAPPGTGTEPGSASGLGAAPAPGTRQFSKALLAVSPPVRTDPREMTTPKNCPPTPKNCLNFYFSKEPPDHQYFSCW